MSGDPQLPFSRPARRQRRGRQSGPVRIEVGRRTAYLHGVGLAALLDEIGSPRMWCPFRKTLACPVDRVDDVLAILEHREGRVVEVVAVDR